MRTPSSEKVDAMLLQELASEYGPHVFVVDHEVIRKTCKAYTECFPNISIFYPVKTNPIKEVVQTIFEQGFGFDVASLNEFKLVMDVVKDLEEKEKMNFIREKIIWAHPVKATSSLVALSKYALLSTYDNVDELKKVKKLAPNTRLLLRVGVSNSFAAYNLSAKFGCQFEEAIPLLEAARAEGLTVEGIAFHVGSQCLSVDPWVTILTQLLKVFKEAEARGFELTKLDIGGGLPVSYEEKKEYLISDYSKAINPLLAQFPKTVRFYAEPGRVIVGEAGTILMEVIGKSFRNGKPCVYLNDGIYGSLLTYQLDFKRTLLTFKEDKEKALTTVFGPTCDCADTVKDVMLPELETNDLVYIPSYGAYSLTYQTPFNDMGNPVVVHRGLAETSK